MFLLAEHNDFINLNHSQIYSSSVKNYVFKVISESNELLSYCNSTLEYFCGLSFD